MVQPKHTWRGAGGSIGHDSLLSAARLRPATRSGLGLGAPGGSAPRERSAQRHLAWLVKARGYQLLSRSSRSARHEPLISCGAAGPPRFVLGGPCSGWLAKPRVGLRAGMELRTSEDKKLCGGKEAGRREGEESDHLLKSDRVGWGAPGRCPKPPGVSGGAAKGPGWETLQSRGWRRGTDRSVPPPSPRSPRAPQPEPQPSTIRSQSPSALSKRLLLLQ